MYTPRLNWILFVLFALAAIGVFAAAMLSPTLRAVFKTLGFKMTLEEFLAQKERFTFVTFDPTDQSTPAPLKADWWWVWLVFIPLCLLFLISVWG
jgi:hypothetical protein